MRKLFSVALISRLASRAGPNTSEVSYLPTIRAMKGARNFVASLAKLQKSEGDKSSVANAYGEEKMSYCPINSLIKATRDEKLTKVMKRKDCPHCGCCRRHCLVSLAAIPSMCLAPKSPSQFSSGKILNFCPRTCSGQEKPDSRGRRS